MQIYSPTGIAVSLFCCPEREWKWKSDSPGQWLWHVCLWRGMGGGQHEAEP